MAKFDQNYSGAYIGSVNNGDTITQHIGRNKVENNKKELNFKLTVYISITIVVTITLMGIAYKLNVFEKLFS